MATIWIVAADSSRARILQVMDREPGSDREEPGTVDHGVELFAKRVSEYLDKARTSHRYDRLHLVAPPKDLSWVNARDLEQMYFRKSP